MDRYTREHLENWLRYLVHSEDRNRARGLIAAQVAAHPGTLDADRCLSWPQVLRVAERNAEAGTLEWESMTKGQLARTDEEE